ncbi:DarT ssDNA thymidine ADP-ribosyltransferase family protein [Mesoflavibacter zeaxanthinifaciens]|uniref:DarT ssDNA thymidine ADP-ribosyltransferase family protein n=1 Tax=Mesoflavibacter zeaxanthinifaciens TaxID=393060 RepID=UPI003A90EF77
MSNNTLSTFQTNWVVKSIPFDIQYRKASSTNDIDKILCTILREKGGNIHYDILGILLGFNIETKDAEVKYGDPAENKIFEYYLKQLENFHLIISKNNIIEITNAGLNSLETGLKYKYYVARITLFDNVTASDNDDTFFPFKDAFDLNNSLNAITELKSIIASDNDSFLKKIDFQLFQNDRFKGETLNFKKTESKENFIEFDINTSLIVDENQVKSIQFEHSKNESTSIDILIKQDQNSELYKAIIRKGEFYHYLILNKPIDSKIIATYLDLWDWSKLVKDSNVTWNDKQVFEIVSQNVDKGIWRTISTIVSKDIMKEHLTEYLYFWDWSILSERFSEAEIKKDISKFPWDFEVLSRKRQDFVIDLLKDSELKTEDWDWSFLSTELPESYITENIERHPWDYFSLTQNRFSIFKEVFNKAFKSGSDSALKFLWDWKYISSEINLNIVYNQLALFAPYINWEIVLKRFFTNEAIIKTFLVDKPFQRRLKELLPRSFRINSQEYHFTKELVTVFNDLDLIDWESEAFLKGFDTNKYLVWDRIFFDAFQENIKTEEGFTYVSSVLLDAKSIFQHPDFNWDWDAISDNVAITGNTKFISYILKEDAEIHPKLNWKLLFANQEVSFWYLHLDEINSKISITDHPEFFTSITEAQDFDIILKKLNFNWDFDYLSKHIEVDQIVRSLTEEKIRDQWDWQIITPRFEKSTIYSNLEELKDYLDWPYIISEVFNVETDLSLETNLEQIAECLANLTQDKNDAAWMALTNKYPIEILFSYIEKTKGKEFFNWNWEAISANKHLKVDLVSINNLRSELNWKVFSGNEAINKIFNPEEDWSNFKEYIQYVRKYLDYFLNDWDWKVLSTNQSLNWNRSIISNYIKQDWDWSFLSEHGRFLRKSKKDADNYLTKILAQFPKINLELVSARTDVIIDNSTLIDTQKLNWNWKALSSNSMVKIDGNTLIQLHNKNWDWEELSSRSDLHISNELIIELQSKLWDWEQLSSSPELRFDQEFTINLIDKPWDWRQLSSHHSFVPTQSLLPKIKRFDLDWESISKHSEFPINRETLSNFKEKLNWRSITKHKNFDVTKTDLISEFKEYLDWNYLSKHDDLSLNRIVLEKFQNYLDWDLLSSNTGIQFDEGLINKFETNWNWNKLRSNNRVKESLSDFIKNKYANSPRIIFLSNIDEQDSLWKNSIYHFTHIENAVEILKNKKIQSRDSANILGDAAGNVVHLRKDAHSFARFYFRPHTPTQFYNEFLGTRTNSGYKTKDGDWVSWYEKSRGLSFPKCPIPIFFKFSLKEVIYDEKLKNCISNGNMQTKSTRFGPIEEMLNNFDYHKLYYTPKKYDTKDDYRIYRESSQQEFLIQDELDFSDYKDFEIICATDVDKVLLEKMLGDEYQKLFSNITVNPYYYNFDNARVDVAFVENNVSINSDFEGDGVFSLETNSTIDKNKIQDGNVTSIMDSKILFKSNLSLLSFVEPFKIKFIDESKREWLIFKTD